MGFFKKESKIELGSNTEISERSKKVKCLQNLIFLASVVICLLSMYADSYFAIHFFMLLHVLFAFSFLHTGWYKRRCSKFSVTEKSDDEYVFTGLSVGALAVIITFSTIANAEMIGITILILGTVDSLRFLLATNRRDRLLKGSM